MYSEKIFTLFQKHGVHQLSLSDLYSIPGFGLSHSDFYNTKLTKLCNEQNKFDLKSYMTLFDNLKLSWMCYVINYKLSYPVSLSLRSSFFFFFFRNLVIKILDTQHLLNSVSFFNHLRPPPLVHFMPQEEECGRWTQ